jgi:hypothetical protein
VRVHYAAADRQAKAQAARGLNREIGRVTGVVDRADDSRIHALAGVGYAHPDESTGLGRGRDRDASAGAAEFDRVPQEVPEDLAEARRIADDPVGRGVERRHDLDGAPANLVAQHLHDLFQHDVDLDAFLGEDETVPRDPRDVEEIVDEADLEIEIAPGRLQSREKRFRRQRDEPAVGHCRHDRREGGSQLMAERGKEMVLGIGARASDLALANQPVPGLLGFPALRSTRRHSLRWSAKRVLSWAITNALNGNPISVPRSLPSIIAPVRFISRITPAAVIVM